MNDYLVTHDQLFRERHQFKACSEYELQQRLEREHPEWFPVQIREILPRREDHEH